VAVAIYQGCAQRQVEGAAEPKENDRKYDDEKHERLGRALAPACARVCVRACACACVDAYAAMSSSIRTWPARRMYLSDMETTAHALAAAISLHRCMWPCACVRALRACVRGCV
jgi:hypothetical protein